MGECSLNPPFFFAVCGSFIQGNRARLLRWLGVVSLRILFGEREENVVSNLSYILIHFKEEGGVTQHQLLLIFRYMTMTKNQ